MAHRPRPRRARRAARARRGLPGPRRAHRAEGRDAPAGAEIRERTGLGASIGIGPNRLVAKVASDAEKPRGFVVLTREQACERFAAAPPGLVPGIGPQTVGAPERARHRHARRARGAPTRTLLAASSARGQGPWLRAPRALRRLGEIEPVREAVSESRETTFDYDLSDPPRLEASSATWPASSASGWRNERRGRTIAIKVRLDDWTTVTRARTIAGGDERPRAGRRGRARAAARVRAGAAGAAARRARRRVRGRPKPAAEPTVQLALELSS